MYFLGGKISPENCKFVTTVYRKPTFSSVYTHFERFLPSTHTFGMLYTLVCRCFTLHSDWTKSYKELVTFKEIFLRNSYPTSFVDNCFKKFFNSLQMVKPNFPTVSSLVVRYLGTISLQERTKARNAMKSTLNCCKIQVIFKREEKLPNMFKFKDPLLLPYDLVSGVVYKYTCGRHSLFYYDETERYLKIRSGEHIGISLPSKESWIRDHFLR